MVEWWSVVVKFRVLKRGQPVDFQVNQIIPGWQEALVMMPKGSKWKVVLPPELAYGEEGRPPQMRGGATLVFDIELLEIVKADAAAAAGAAAGAVEAPPASK